MENSSRTVRTARLRLIPWNLDLIDAFASGDRALAERALDIEFPEPFAPPPETGDVLEVFRRAVEEDGANGAFLPRMIVRETDSMSVGSIGLGASDERGVSDTGYSVYPQFEGNGYASEAATGLVAWGLQLEGVAAIVATIAVGHFASEIVSQRAGLVKTDRQIEEDGALLNVWERKRSDRLPLGATDK